MRIVMEPLFFLIGVFAECCCSFRKLTRIQPSTCFIPKTQWFMREEKVESFGVRAHQSSFSFSQVSLEIIRHELTTRICKGEGDLSSFTKGLRSSRGPGGMLPFKIGYLRLAKVDFPPSKVQQML